ncbi:MAG: class I SAM-dependent methyltransferase [Bacteroidetes bacterium QH_2_67_10]|nr:MAG: class I SAM-dependent methyltransferase [Bacteroidetes bacterium QH_2_67_10]
MQNPQSKIEDDDPARPRFWDEKYESREALFGTAPNAFVRAAASRIPQGARVAEVGAGEARNLLYLARERDADVTAVDFAEEGLRAARRRAEAAGISLKTTAADARTWRPGRPFDAVLVTFLHLLPEARVESYRRLRDALVPGGVLVAEWFSDAHADKGRFAEIGPSTPKRLISAHELREHFPQGGIEVLEETERDLDEGPILKGRAAVLRFAWRKPIS